MAASLRTRLVFQEKNASPSSFAGDNFACILDWVSDKSACDTVANNSMSQSLVISFSYACLCPAAL